MIRYRAIDANALRRGLSAGARSVRLRPALRRATSSSAGAEPWSRSAPGLLPRSAGARSRVDRLERADVGIDQRRPAAIYAGDIGLAPSEAGLGHEPPCEPIRAGSPAYSPPSSMRFTMARGSTVSMTDHPSLARGLSGTTGPHRARWRARSDDGQATPRRTGPGAPRAAGVNVAASAATRQGGVALHRRAPESGGLDRDSERARGIPVRMTDPGTAGPTRRGRTGHRRRERARRTEMPSPFDVRMRPRWWPFGLGPDQPGARHVDSTATQERPEQPGAWSKAARPEEQTGAQPLAATGTGSDSGPKK